MLALVLPLLVPLAPALRPVVQEAPQAPPVVTLDGDEHKRYVLHGPAPGAKAPKKGWKVLVVLPGGNGSAEFAPFVGRIRANALGEDWLVVQPVAPVWSEDQAQSNVWPTKRNPWPKMKFSCEELFAEVLADVRKKHKTDKRFLYTLAWSSSGSLAYSLALDPKSPVTGSFIAMSVYKPDLLPSRKHAKGHSFYLLHSPEDFIPIRMARQARDELTAKGARVELVEYAGGHGWHGDVYGLQRAGFAWLQAAQGKGK